MSIEANMPHSVMFNVHLFKYTAAGTGCFDEHVSFAVLSLQPSPYGGKYLALATDTSRNIIMESGTDRIVRNLYGHKNDGFSNPKVAWSSNGQVRLILTVFNLWISPIILPSSLFCCYV
jgi:hypothetical protein